MHEHLRNLPLPKTKSRDSQICPRRLINTSTRKFVEFSPEETVPQYAILSHRWENTLKSFDLPEGRESFDPGEVSYQEFLDAQTNLNAEAHSKSGYRKIFDACSKTLELKLEYIWIDTCCIDQDNQVEVACNIKSMYAYYQNSAVCLVYLYDTKQWSDVEVADWFKRGWTLQELVAPKEVYFFNNEWTFIGCKATHKKDISNRTGIPEGILDGSMPILDVHPQVRLSWLWGRETSKPADLAYCLMGILDFELEPDPDQSEDVMFQRMERALCSYTNISFSAEFLMWGLRTSRQTLPSGSVTREPHKKYQKCPLRFIDTRSLEIVDFQETETIPSYAILSHRWKEQEVTLRQYRDPQFDRKNKLGYLKIRNACFVALRLKLNYLWVDTCCIDQDDPKDVDRNINSMFAYYQNAAVCLAYIFDAESSESSLARSEWFTRGWTLQELVAPTEVFFFDKDWVFIGTRSGLTPTIYWITGIDESVLRGGNIHRVHARNRIGWARGRKTTVSRDLGYCLLGILGIEMAVDEKEKVETTFERLEEAFSLAYPEVQLPLPGLFLFLVGEARNLPIGNKEKGARTRFHRAFRVSTYREIGLGIISTILTVVKNTVH